MRTLAKTVFREATAFLVPFALVCVFQTAAWGMYSIPSESMLPTLSVGDRILVNKFAYGYSRHGLPFSIGPQIPTPTGRLFGETPARGDVVVFRNPNTGVVTIKRVIGLPGDRIEISAGRLSVNGVLAEREAIDAYRYAEHRGGVTAVVRFEETLPGGECHGLIERSDRAPGDNFGPARVPEGTLFVMGDNRDNSLDSRFGDAGVGFVPLDHLIGRADRVVFSVNLGRAPEGLRSHAGPWLRRID